MKANAGGNIAPSDVIGRDELIALLWSTLDGQSVVLSSERRTGKTCIFKKMISNPPPGVLPIYRDLESVHSVAEFMDTTVQDLDRYLDLIERAKAKGRQFTNTFKGWQFGNLVKLPENNVLTLKTLLMQLVQKVVQKQKQKLVLFWDELPMMLDNIRKKQNEQISMELLDLFRAIRQQCPQIRMVFAGSIGIHHVLSALKDKGYSNDATNDMAKHEVPALTEAYSRDLASKLLDGEKIQTTNRNSIAGEIAEASCHIPYYTHHIVTKMKQQNKVICPGMAKAIVQDCINDLHDPLHLSHYEQRLKTYYDEPASQEMALAILDVLASEVGPLKHEEIFRLVQAKIKIDDKELFRKIIQLLELDHYTAKAADQAVGFRLALLQKWWQAKRL